MLVQKHGEGLTVVINCYVNGGVSMHHQMIEGLLSIFAKRHRINISVFYRLFLFHALSVCYAEVAMDEGVIRQLMTPDNRANF